ncbi:MAG: HNH endonuclease [Actinobacteria bacterium]|nr:HNH endonuclease [Actinomycetota bacterium]MBU1608205.1 HNH endonuclease [Actinomycetota bacterium]MBU2315716.1 HNH endonuclease [Actinomycetota bacterium]MBU2384878.1 HNH endonuclease [Actinomycetota bacterium]
MTTSEHPRTATAAVDGGVSAILDAIVALERLTASLAASRAVAIDELRHLILVAAERDAQGGRAGGWDTAVTARRVAATELATALRISESAAQSLLDESAALTTTLPGTHAALREGALSYAHTVAIVDEARNLPPSSHDEFENTLLPESTTRTAAGLRQRARIVRERLHPESIDERCRDARERRDVRLEPARDGMAWLTAYLPAENAIAAYRRVSEIATGLGGSGDAAHRDDRTLAQRRADVMTDLLHDGIVSGSGAGRGVRAQVLVTVPALTLLDRGAAPVSPVPPATLEGYGPISADVARRLAAHAPSFTRLLTHPETGAVLSVGRDRYAVPRDLRLWLRIRDETCRFPGCGRSAASADVDHTVDWQHSGATRHDNLAHLCEAHHRLKHQTAWLVHQAGGGVLEWTAPSGRQYRTDPATRLAC